MRMKALLALLGLGLALMVFAGCSDSNDNNNTPTGTVTVQGTITNASTGLPQENATVKLFRNGTQIGNSFVTGTEGQYTFNNVAARSGYTLRVSGEGFQTVTSDEFTVSEGMAPIDIVVGSGVITGTTISGIVGTTDPNATFTVKAVNSAGNTVATTTTGTTVAPDNGPQFTLNNVPAGSNYSLVVTSPEHPGIVTVFGPLELPESGRSNLTIFTKTAEQIMTDTADQIGTIPPASGQAKIAVYFPSGSGTISVNGVTSANGNPAFLTNVPVSNNSTTVTINPQSGESFTLPFIPASGTVTVVRIAPALT